MSERDFWTAPMGSPHTFPEKVYQLRVSKSTRRRECMRAGPKPPNHDAVILRGQFYCWVSFLGPRFQERNPKAPYPRWRQFCRACSLDFGLTTDEPERTADFAWRARDKQRQAKKARGRLTAAKKAARDELRAGAKSERVAAANVDRLAQIEAVEYRRQERARAVDRRSEEKAARLAR